MISIIALILSIITSVRLFLLDKKSGEFIISKDNNNRVMSKTEMSLDFDIKKIKSNLYKLNINGDLSLFTINGKKCYIKQTSMNINEIEEINISSLLVRERMSLKMIYEDELNNVYEQYIYVDPFSKLVQMSDRRWLFFESIRRKYLNEIIW
jgi:uncharacterized pyridoxamine 5'-phosphate oxidase family protein